MKSRILVFTTIAAIFVNLSFAISAEFRLADRTKDPTGYSDKLTFTMTGSIEAGDSKKLDRLLNGLKVKGETLFRNMTISLNSPGGSLDPSIKLAELIREWGLATLVDEGHQCLSGCAIVFMAGSWREGDGEYDPLKTLHRKGVLGFHAPFAFADTKLPAEVQQLLLPDAERGGAIAASKLVKLSLKKMIPASLVEALLQYKSNTFLYIDTVDRAGRWQINLAEQEPVKIDAAAIMTRHASLGEHCNNSVAWNNDQSYEERDGKWSLEPNSLRADGMNNGCEYKPFDGKVSYTVNGLHGFVLEWQTLVANTKLASLSAEQLGSKKIQTDPFVNPPPSQWNGSCHKGYQWIGGWSGASWRDAVAHASYRRCDGSSTTISYRCTHGSGKITSAINLTALGASASSRPKVTTQVDDNYELSGGSVSVENGFLEFSSTLSKGYFTFEQIKSGSKLVVRVSGVSHEVHLKGSRKAFEAMEKSCL